MSISPKRSARLTSARWRRTWLARCSAARRCGAEADGPLSLLAPTSPILGSVRHRGGAIPGF
jgi:hypothetical protein